MPRRMMYAALQPRMTCSNRPRKPGRTVLVLAALAAACSEAPSRPASGSSAAPEANDPKSEALHPNVLQMTPKMRNLSNHKDNFEVRKIDGLPDELGRRKPIDVAKRSEPAAAPQADAATGTPADASPGFLGKDDRKTLEALRSGQLQDASRATTGRTLAFKVALDSGVLGNYKPEQRLSGTSWAAEVAAYYIDRALGLGRVPPVVSRRLPWPKLVAAAADDPQKSTVRVEKGEVRGALIGALDQPLVPVATPHGWEDWIRIEAFDPFAITPFQPADTYAKALATQKKRPPTPIGTRPDRRPGRAELAAELSDLILFDYLIGNAERFSPDNANAVTLGAKGPLIATENAGAFVVTGARQTLLDAQLGALQKFRRRTIDALRALDIGALKATLGADPLGPLLDAAALRGVQTRRTAILDHVAKEQKRLGDSVFAW